jgi:hypothetical protein
MIATPMKWVAVLSVVAATVAFAASEDDLKAASVEKLKLKVPGGWKHTVEETTHTYVAPNEEASFALSVFPVDPKRKGEECLDQLLKALGGDGWERIKVGGAPAAFKVSNDSGELESGEAVASHSYVGCDGSTKWTLTATHILKKKTRFEPLSKKVVDSIRYSK